MLTVINPDNTFSGVQYNETKQKYINHHKQYNQKLIWLERVVEEGEVTTEEELQNEVLIGDDIAQEGYLLDIDFRVSCMEMGVNINDL